MVEDVDPTAVWEALENDPNAHLVDVRTDAEWNFVGLPDLRSAGKKPLTISWQVFPAMQVNGRFVEQLKATGLTPEHRIFFLCRSGGRSQAAAHAAQQAGFPQAYNIAHGFEGPPGPDGHRGGIAGWKASGLPWRQG